MLLKIPLQSSGGAPFLSMFTAAIVLYLVDLILVVSVKYQ